MGSSQRFLYVFPINNIPVLCMWLSPTHCVLTANPTPKKKKNKKNQTNKKTNQTNKQNTKPTIFVYKVWFPN
jgi:hypothetical protein